MMKLIALIVVGGLLLTGVALFSTSARAQIDRFVQPDDATLYEGLSNTIELVDETVLVLDLATPAATDGTNADIALVGDLANNYSVFDHSDQRRFPGFNDCDSWRNLIDDGWQASYGRTAFVADSDDALAAARKFWTSRGYNVNKLGPDDTRSGYSRLWIDTRYARIQLSMNEHRGSVELRGTTRCLTPG